MNKHLWIFVTSLFLTGCSLFDKLVQKAIEQTQSVIATEIPAIESEPKNTNGKIKSWKCLGNQEVLGFKTQISRIIIADKNAIEADIDFSYFQVYDDTPVVIGIFIQYMNNSENFTSPCAAYDTVITVESQQIELADFYWESHFGDDLNWIYPGVIKNEGFWIGVKNLSVDDIKKIGFYRNGPCVYESLADGLIFPSDDSIPKDYSPFIFDLNQLAMEEVSNSIYLFPNDCE